MPEENVTEATTATENEAAACPEAGADVEKTSADSTAPIATETAVDTASEPAEAPQSEIAPEEVAVA